MARGRKPALTLDEQLEKITAEIENMELILKKLKSAKKDLIFFPFFNTPSWI